MSRSQVLIVEDDPSLQEALCDTLSLAGFPVLAAGNGPAALEALSRDDIGMVVSDVQMEQMDGHALLKKIKSGHPQLPVVLMTAYGTIQKAVDAMRSGASDYLVKPFEPEVLVDMISRYLPNLERSETDLVQEDPRSAQLVSLAARVAGSDATVMISGDSGTGKEVLARFIHESSKRADGPFVAINCAAIPENMLEAVLFGYEKGAFTGAYQARAGKFEQAQGGTLLLDEISEMDLGLQAKLLRVLQEREVERLGGKELIPLNVRVLATTNRIMREEVAAGRFREDLFYRLNVFPLHICRLCDRPADILPLAVRLVQRHYTGGKPLPRFSREAEKALRAHAWAGNVRELENVIQRALILMSGDVIEVPDLQFECDPAAMAALSAVPVATPDELPEITEITESPEKGLETDLKSRENQLILDALEADAGSRKLAAERLGISPRTLRYKLARMRDAGIAIPA